MNIAIEVYPWDLEDEGIDAVLARISGDLGADTVTVGAILPETHSIRRRATSGPRVIRMPSGAHFQPDGRFYAGTRIRPVTTPWLRQRNPLERIARRVADHRLNLRIRLSCCDVPALVEKYPMAGTIDVFGEPHGERLCLSNPDVRAYLGAVVEDLSTNYKPVEIELASIAFEAEPWRALYWKPSGVSVAEAFLLGVCFCSSCREGIQAGGVDVGAAAKDVHVALDEEMRLERPEDQSLEQFVSQYRNLVEYKNAQGSNVIALLGQLRKRVDTPLILKCKQEELTAPWARAVDANVDATIEVIKIGSRGMQRADVFVDQADNPPHREIRLSFDSTFRDSQAMIRLVKRASDRGFRAVEFAKYGAMVDPILDWIRQAIRFAKRG